MLFSFAAVTLASALAVQAADIQITVGNNSQVRCFPNVNRNVGIILGDSLLSAHRPLLLKLVTFSTLSCMYSRRSAMLVD